MFRLRSVLLAFLLLFASHTGAESEGQVGGYIVADIQASGEISYFMKGLADPESDTPVTEDTIFHIASLSKQITAAVLADAILSGRVALNDPVADYIHEIRHYGRRLTIAHLLYFTSGLTEAYELPRPGNIPWTTHYYFTVDDAIAASVSVPVLNFKPGTVWQYNNINFQMIAELLERVHGQRFSALARDRIFNRLSMNATLINDDITTAVPGRAVGVVPRNPAVVEQLRSSGVETSLQGGPIIIRRNAPHYGGSGVLTSMADWMKWQRDMLTHTHLGEDFWSLMFSTRAFEHDKSNDAFGLVHGQFQGVSTVWFAGSDIDGASYMIASQKQGVAAACFSNNPLFDCQTEALRAFESALEAR